MLTGGQYVLQGTRQFERVELSLANQYKVIPAALVSTIPLLVLIVLIAPEPVGTAAAGLDATAAGWDVAELGGLALVPQAASNAHAAAGARPASHRLRMQSSPSCCLEP